MHKLLYSTILLSTLLYSTSYNVVFEKSIYLDKENRVKLKLLEEKSKEMLEKPAKVQITSEDGATELYSFEDDDKNFPIYYFDKLKLNTQTKKLVNLKSSVNVFDVDKNGKNEIFIYGASYRASGDSVGKILILEKENGNVTQQVPLIEAYNNYEMKYYPKEQIIIVAQNIQRYKLESRVGDSYTYQFYIYDVKNNFKKIPIMLSKNKLDSNDKNLIEKSLNKILNKYHQYKKGQIELQLAEDYEMIQFVKGYWKKISEKNLNFLETVLKKQVFYYSKKFSKSKIIQDKKRALGKVKNIDFTLSDFLVYIKNNHFYVEYTKSYNIDDYEVSGTVKSLMILERINNKIYINTEKDTAVLELGTDGE